MIDKLLGSPIIIYLNR